MGICPWEGHKSSRSPSWRSRSHWPQSAAGARSESKCVIDLAVRFHGHVCCNTESYVIIVCKHFMTMLVFVGYYARQVSLITQKSYHHFLKIWEVLQKKQFSKKKKHVSNTDKVAIRLCCTNKYTCMDIVFIFIHFHTPPLLALLWSEDLY